MACSIAHHIVFLLAGSAGEAIHSGRPVLEVGERERECDSDWQEVLAQDHTRHLSLAVLAEQSRTLVPTDYAIRT